MDKLCSSSFVVFGLIVIVSAEWVTPGSGKWSSKEKVICCYDEMVKDCDISHLLLDVSSSKKVERFCERILGLKKCISDNEHHLSVAENTAYLQKTNGVNNFFLAICSPGSDLAIKYKKVSQCFQLIKDKILHCGSDLPDLSSYKMQKDKKSKCCALRLHRECMSAAALEGCGREGAEVTAEITRRYFLSEGCQGLRHDCEDPYWPVEDEWRRHHHKKKSSAAGSSSASLVLSFLVCVWSLFVKLNV